MRSVWALGIILAVFAGEVGAQQAPPAMLWYVNPYLGGITPDKPWRATGNAALYGLNIGMNLSPGWSGEIDLNATPLKERGGAGHVGLSGGALELVWGLDRLRRFAPYVSIGAGVTHNDAASEAGLESRTELMIQPGFGAFIRIWARADGKRSLALRPEIKLRWTHGWAHAPGNPVDPLYVCGLTYAF
jgi:hypothetical protein